MKPANQISLTMFVMVLLAACSGNSTDRVADSASSDSAKKEATLPLQLIAAQEALYEVIDREAKAEILGSGYAWTEGPLWIPSEGMLLFSEIPANRVHAWKQGAEDPEVYLDPAGFTGEGTRGGELGSNGLLLDPEGNLVLCQHGDRRLARMTAPIANPAAEYETIVGEFNNQRFNSPNDAAYDAAGNLYFTDPPYGLEHRMEDPAKEIPYQGVFRYSQAGDLSLLLDSLTRPNGLAFFPGGNQLLIANSDPDKPYWYRYSVAEDGSLSQGEIYRDASDVGAEEPGLPDGLKIRSDGTVFATGPGGVWIFDPEGQELGRIDVGQRCSNVALNETEDVLFVTADSYVLRIELK
ncbi:SMP-30/gluconolactonase/LRE family protein [Cyclobacterium xiamenense]|nr:SMP-30/gluconolactonase/LRE family protein [Cyclobacterium xiamenense]